MKYPSFISVSILVNIIIVAFLFLKSNLHQDSFTLSHKTIAYSNHMLKEETLRNKSNCQSNLRKLPQYKVPINTGIDAIFEKAKEAVSVIKMIEEDLYRTESDQEMHQLFKDHSRQIMIENVLKHFAYSCKVNYTKTIDQLLEEKLWIGTQLLTVKEHNELISLDLNERMLMLHKCSRIDAQMILQSFELEVRNLAYLYTNELVSNVPNSKPILNRLMLSVNPKKETHQLGDTIEFDVQIGAIMDRGLNAVFTVNGKEYQADENGIAQYSEKPQKKGRNLLKINTKASNPLTGERYVSSSEFSYIAVD